MVIEFSQKVTEKTDLPDASECRVQTVVHLIKQELQARGPQISCLMSFSVPEVPAAIKALAVNISSILVAWQPPVSPNGILTHYTVYYRNATSPGVGSNTKQVLGL